MNLRSIEDLERNNFILVAEILESTIQRAIQRNIFTKLEEGMINELCFTIVSYQMRSELWRGSNRRF